MERGPRRIVFIGMTQNGKSSLVREILKYGGQQKAAARIEVGDGNSSQTQQCSMYSVRISKKQHFLRDVDTKSHVEPHEDVDEDTVEDLELDLSSSFDLEIVDTPGLGESRNSNAIIAHDENEFQDKDGNMVPWRIDSINMKTADERHKIGIVQALWKVGTIHAVCFVIKKESFSEDLQQMIASVQEVFQSTSRHTWDLEYHIIHTSVGKEERFAGYPVNRERQFRQKFVGMRSTHHFVDNLPDRDDPVSRHFAKASLASMLARVAEGKGVSMKNLKYMKNGVQVTTDAQLCNGIMGLKRSYEYDLATARTKLRNAEKQRDGYTNQLKGREETLAKTESQVRDIDSDTLVECGSSTKTATSWSELWYGLEINVSSVENLPIKDIDYKPNPTSGYFSDKSEGTYTVRAKIRSSSGLFAQTGTITLKTYKRLKEGRRLEALKRLENTQRQARDAAATNLRVAEASVSALQRESAFCEKALAKLEQDRSLTMGNSFDMSLTNESLYSFTVAASYAAAEGYGIKQRVPKSRLPAMEISNLDCITELMVKRRQQVHVMEVRKAILSGLQDQVASRTQLTETLHSKALEFSAVLVAQEKKRDAVQTESLTLTSYPMASIPARKVYANMKENAKIASDIAFESEEAKCAYSKQVALTFRNAYEQLLRLQKKLQAAAAFEDHQIRRLGLWLKAADLVVDMIKETELPLGAFIVVERALEFQIVNPYLVLCLEVWQSLLAKERI